MIGVQKTPPQEGRTRAYVLAISHVNTNQYPRTHLQCISLSAPRRAATKIGSRDWLVFASPNDRQSDVYAGMQLAIYSGQATAANDDDLDRSSTGGEGGR